MAAAMKQQQQERDHSRRCLLAPARGEQAAAAIARLRYRRGRDW